MSFQPMMYKSNIGGISQSPNITGINHHNPNMNLNQNPNQLNNIIHHIPYQHYNSGHLTTHQTTNVVNTGGNVGINTYNNSNNHNNNVNHNHSHNHNINNNHNNNNNQKNKTNKNKNNNNNKSGPTKDTWKSPCSTQKENLRFFMFNYKVEACPHKRNCPSKVTCRGWHHEGERRRNPVGKNNTILYSEEPCPNVKSQGSNKWKQPHLCSDGDDCQYSHTLLEQMYHPNIYKTSMCINFTNPTGNKCQWGYYCTHAHGPEDIRSPKTALNNDSFGNVNAKSSNTNNTNNNDNKNKSSSQLIMNGNNSQNDSKSRMRARSDGDPRYGGGYDHLMMNNNNRQNRLIQMNQFSPQRTYYDTNINPNPNPNQQLIDMNRSPLAMRGYQTYTTHQNDSFRLNTIGHNELRNNPYINEDLLYPPGYGQTKTQQQQQQHVPPLPSHQLPKKTTFNPNSKPFIMNSNKQNNINNNDHNNNNRSRSYSEPDKLLYPKETSLNWKNGMTTIPDSIDLPSLKNIISPLVNESDQMITFSPKNARKLFKKTPTNDNINTSASELPALNQVMSSTPPPPSAETLKKKTNKSANSSSTQQHNNNNSYAHRTRQKRTQSLPAPTPHGQHDSDFPLTNPNIEVKLSNDSFVSKDIYSLVSPLGSNNKYKNSKTKNIMDYFGFSDPNTPRQYTSLNAHNKSSNNKPKDLPSTPPPVFHRQLSKKKDNDSYNNDPQLSAEIDRLRKQVKLLENQIKVNKDKNGKDNDADSDSKEPSNDDDLDDDISEDSVGITKNETISDENRRRLKIYWNIITCPKCDKCDVKRNQVLIPCGHLLCFNCGHKNLKHCPICKKKIKSIQVLKLN